jgi:aminoglycoside phosphotransferase family enzyme
MNDDSKQIMMDLKCANIITAMSQMYDVTLEEATDIFYNSETAELIQEGVADLHCRSDKYLAGEIWEEYQEKKQ